MNEAETRAEHIDPALAAAGWGVVEGSRIQREFQITHGRIQGAGKRGKAEIADYARPAPAPWRTWASAAVVSACTPATVICCTWGMYSKSSPRPLRPAVRPK